MSTTYDIDEVITVDETIEKGYFYLENRKFRGPFESEERASLAALENCKLTTPGECRAIYHGSAKMDQTTRLNEPMSDMRQTASVECP
tara:strand:- start:22908 stop:23171 length:264 start_codon:yes stop_codon:yes gene_type:complete